jgi:hypothetical protein
MKVQWQVTACKDSRLLPLPRLAAAVPNVKNPHFITNYLVIGFIRISNDHELIDARLIGCGCNESIIGQSGNAPFNETFNGLCRGGSELIQV